MTLQIYQPEIRDALIIVEAAIKAVAKEVEVVYVCRNLNITVKVKK
jgi:hypothetical protein